MGWLAVWGGVDGRIEHTYSKGVDRVQEGGRRQRGRRGATERPVRAACPALCAPPRTCTCAQLAASRAVPMHMQVAMFPAQCAPWLLAPESAAVVASLLAGQHLQQQQAGAGSGAAGASPSSAVPPAVQQALLEAVATALEAGGVEAAGGPSDELLQLYETTRHVAASSPEPAVRALAAEVVAALSAALG